MTPFQPTTSLHEHPQATVVPAMTNGEYRAFLQDIRVHGIQTPLEVTTASVVLDGRHRLQAARELGLATVPVTVVEPQPEDEVAYMIRSAMQRRQLSASQKAALTVELAEIEEASALARARRQANLQHASVDVATLPHRAGRPREHAAEIAGVSARVIQDTLLVHQRDPDLFAAVKAGELPAHKAARQVRRADRYAEMAAAPPLPDGSFELILADPPWQLGSPDSPLAPENHYPTMTVTEICGLPVPAADHAVLFLWAVNSLLPEALQVIDAWGFTYKSQLVWVKPSIGSGIWVRNRHELLLVARRGSFPPPEPSQRADSVIEAKRGRHSEKPAEAYELIERAYPQASKLELFARGIPRAGWAAWGNEVIAA